MTAYDELSAGTRFDGAPGSVSPTHGRVVSALVMAALGLAVCLRFANLEADIPPQQNADDLGDEGYWFLPARDLFYFGAFDRESNFLQAQAGAPLTVVTLAALAFAAGSIDHGLVRSLSAFYSSLILALGVLYFDRLKRMPLAGLCFVALYGLLPVTLLYGRTAHLEQHVLFYLFASFVVLERARSAGGYAAAGALLSVAIAAKAVSVIVVPAFVAYLVARRTRPLAEIAAFAAGVVPILALLAAHLWLNAERFAPTIAALQTYQRGPGPFVDGFSVRYFWSSPLVRWYVPWLGVGLVAQLFARTENQDSSRRWMLLWLTTVFVALSLLRYQSYARHMLLLFPLLLLTSLSIGQLHRRATASVAGPVFSGACVLALAATVLASSGAIAGGLLVAPRHSYRHAARTLAAITDETDRIVGVHNFALSIPGRYRPKMTLNARNWRGVDPLAGVDPTGALIATVFNGQRPTGQWDRVFVRREQFPYAERMQRLAYLDRFAIDFYRVFSARADYLEFLRFRQGRPSRYDGLIYNMYKDDTATGCMVKGVLVAESRGDPEVSHHKISATGCAGMMGFCYQTATEARFSDLFPRLVPRLRPAATDPSVFEKDDRFVPGKALRAGERYLRDLERRFAGYTDAPKLVFAAYNGGSRLTTYLIEKAGGEDPRWDEDLLATLRALGAQPVPGYEAWSAVARRHKLQVELPGYVSDASATYEACREARCFAVSYR